MNISKRPNTKGDKTFLSLEWGRGAGKRLATGIFLFTRPQNQAQKKHNQEALLLIETKRSELMLEQQAAGTGFIPSHKILPNFFDYYQQFVKENLRKGNRHLENSLSQFHLFIGKSFLSPIDITENLCHRFRQFLLGKFTGETPANYFLEFKKMIRAATKTGYWRYNPAEDLKAKTNASKRLKENLEADEYIKLLKTPCHNEEVKDAFLFSCYTGLRYVDTKSLKWADMKENRLTTRIIQHKTGKPVVLTLHPIAMSILEKRRKVSVTDPGEEVFGLPTHDGSNKVLRQWVADARIDKYITWSCARLSFSILLQDKNVDVATVAYLMGHTTSVQVNKTYRRHRPLNQEASVNKLPVPEETPYFLKN
jgi:integrase